jgi:hypothetical protein
MAMQQRQKVDPAECSMMSCGAECCGWRYLAITRRLKTEELHREAEG